MTQLAFNDYFSGNSGSGRKLPPMLEQYLDYKSRFPDYLLLFQVGDFYELFFDDAVTVSRTLNLTLTSRDKTSPNPVPMCGVPIGAVDGYLDRLVDAGFSVALVSQVGDPKASKGMVERQMDRLITPAVRVAGTHTNRQSLAVGVVAVVRVTDLDCSLAFTEPESGVVQVVEKASFQEIVDEILALQPREMLLPRALAGKQIDRRSGWVRELEQRVPDLLVRFQSDGARLSGERQKQMQALDGYGDLFDGTRMACSMLVHYLDEITLHHSLTISKIERREKSGFLILDAMTVRNLELLRSQKTLSNEGSLYGYLNHCMTPGGARLLRHWVVRPLARKADIEGRQAIVRTFRKDRALREALRADLSRISDLERLAARIDLSLLAPREAAVLRDTLMQLPRMNEYITAVCAASKHAALQLEALPTLQQAADLLSRALVDEPSQSFGDGEVLQGSYDTDLERLRSIAKSGSSWVMQLEKRERESTGIPSLKVRYNNVLGYFIEVTKAQRAKVPDHYVSRQSMVSAERFFTTELKDREKEILQARVVCEQHERKLFEDLRETLRNSTSLLRRVHRAISELDLYATFAELCERDGLVIPRLTEERGLRIDQGKHPILMHLLEGRCIPNSFFSGGSEARVFILTGPNMGGKSTYLRQVGLLAILAHMGCGVPAKSLTFSPCDRIFARLGASDDMLEGQSTFMVEMREAAHILRSATQNSLVLIDEIGRGTSTTDGQALARAILETIIDTVGSTCLFATHFHALTALSERSEAVANVSVQSVRDGDAVVFTHNIVTGPASRSYGFEVALMAGVPKAVVERARAVWSTGSADSSGTSGTLQAQLLEGAQIPSVDPLHPEERAIISELRELCVLETRPIDALATLDRWSVILERAKPYASLPEEGE